MSPRFLAVIAVSLFAVTLAGSAAAADRPNIIYILADDMGCGDVSTYNPKSAWKTPAIDGLAGRGMVFTDAHSSSAVCTPSRYSILTGRYSWRSRLKQGVTQGFSEPVIEEGRLTVAQLLHDHGYETAMLGKWHLGLRWATTAPTTTATAELNVTQGEPSRGRADRAAPLIDYGKPFRQGPTDFGFDHFLGISASLDMPPYVWLRDDRVETPPTHTVAAHALPEMWRAGPAALEHVDVLPRLTQEAEAYIRRDHGGKPFFLYLAFTAPHTPIVPDQQFTGSTHTTPYGDFCAQVDAAVGRVLRALQEQHLDQNTLVIFTADNGCSPSANFEQLRQFHHDPQMGLRGEKADIYEGGHRIPFIVSWPGHVAPAVQSAATVCEIDFMATCAQLVGATVRDNAAEDSVSLLPILTGKAQQVRTSLVHHSINGSFAIRKGPWKLCLCPDSGGWSDPRPGKAPAGSPPFQLFNLEQDPAETNNLYAQHPELVRELGALLKQQVLQGRSTPGAPQSNTGGNDWRQLGWMKGFPSL